MPSNASLIYHIEFQCPPRSVSLEWRHTKLNHKDVALPTVSTVDSTKIETLGEIDNERKHSTFISEIGKYLEKEKPMGNPVRHGFNTFQK